MNDCTAWYNWVGGEWTVDAHIKVSECSPNPTIEPTLEPTLEPTTNPTSPTMEPISETDVIQQAIHHDQKGDDITHTTQRGAIDNTVMYLCIIIGILICCIISGCFGFAIFYIKCYLKTKKSKNEEAHSTITMVTSSQTFKHHSVPTTEDCDDL